MLEDKVTNPVGTKEQRDRRHRLLGEREIGGELLCTDCPDRLWPCDARVAFDGLDIAEEMAVALRRVPHWRNIEVLAKWDKWQEVE